jgi:hypothetical protein
MATVRELDRVKLETNRGEPVVEAFARAQALLQVFYPAGLVGRGLNNPTEPKALMLKDGTFVFAGSDEHSLYFRIRLDGDNFLAFELDGEGLVLVTTGRPEGYFIRRSDFSTEDPVSFARKWERKQAFEKLSADLVQWLGMCIFGDEFQPLPQKVESSLKEFLNQGK